MSKAQSFTGSESEEPQNMRIVAAWRCTQNQSHKLETLPLSVRHQHDLSQMLHRSATAKPGQRVLIHGASGYAVM